jgi:ATP-dependent Lhr-like helicase
MTDPVLSSFHPAVRAWFESKLGAPTPPQSQGWPLIQSGHHVLIAAPTGSGKTLAAFLSAIDALARQGPYLENETQVLYISPLKALSNDVQKNLEGPLAEIRERDPFIPAIRVMVRTGDTSAKDRAKMVRTPPHIVVTTPESLYILLTSDKGRAMLSTTKTVIVDEIHALARDKRGSHLALSLERLETLVGKPVQRIGLSATQKPLEDVARFLGGDRAVELVDAGAFRSLDVAVEVPKSPLEAACSHEVWEEIYERMAALIRDHKTTLVFVNTRKLAERIAARLAKILGDDAVTSHHGSLSRSRRLDAEQRLKAGALRALVATASLELGIDIGDVDLAIQVGSSRSIATFLQRVGRAGHAVKKIPKGRLFPLTMDELVEAAAVLDCVRSGILDRTPQPPAPLDILAQQAVAACVPEPWSEDDLFTMAKRSWPYRDLKRADFDALLAMHADGRRALLHRDGVNRRVMATRRARLTAITSGGAIPDVADYQVLLEPDGTPVGTVNEDFAIESNAGDIFQLGTTSWRIVKVEPGIVRVADAKGMPPTLPFWTGEAPGRTRELSAAMSSVRESWRDVPGVSDEAKTQILEYVAAGKQALGTVPTQKRVVLERFFDEAGGTQIVMHAPFGSRINRAWGLALRKRFCVGFGFELQAAANEEAIVLSLGPQHSFKLEDVFKFLHPNTARDVLVQALLAAPMFETRWRWNVQRALLLERMQSGKKVPAPLLRMRANDLLVMAFPQVLACPETLPGGPLPVPDHVLVRQTIEDCLTEPMDIDGFLEVIKDIREGRIETVAIDTPEPSAFARGILSAAPYAFLDDAPLEERRTQAVLQRRTLDPKTADTLGELDPEAVERVRDEAWPKPENAEEVHEALTWMGYVTEDEAKPWQAWLAELGPRVVVENQKIYAAEAARDPKSSLRGRLEAVVPLLTDDPVMLELEHEGVAMRARIGGREVWCHRRLLARIQRYTLDRLRKEIEPVAAADFLRFLGCWQHVDEEHKLEGPRGVAEVVGQLAGFEVPAWAWEGAVLPARIRGYKREWLDQLTMSGEAAWGRVLTSGAGPIKTTPVAIVPREDLDTWLSMASTQLPVVSGNAAPILEALTARGAMFPQEVAKATKLLPAHIEMGLAELIAAGQITCDSYGALRWLIVPPSRRRSPVVTVGRWSLLRRAPASVSPDFVARQFLKRTGVVFRKTIEREKIPVPWRDVVRVLRLMEARGEVRGGRFVAGFAGEQYAMPEAVSLLRAVRRRGELSPVTVSAADPLNYRGILTPDEKISPATKTKVRVG